MNNMLTKTYNILRKKMKRRIAKKVAISALVFAVSTSVIINMTAYEILKKIGLKA